jgi:hypothetical protein
VVALTPGRGPRPAFDVEARARLAPADIDAAAPGCTEHSFLSQEASQLLEAWCQAWFDDQQGAKAMRVRGRLPRRARLRPAALAA